MPVWAIALIFSAHSTQGLSCMAAHPILFVLMIRPEINPEDNIIASAPCRPQLPGQEG